MKFQIRTDGMDACSGAWENCLQGESHEVLAAHGRKSGASPMDGTNVTDTAGAGKARSPLVILSVLFLLLFGASYCLYYGRIGYMPMDQSVMFDGGWRVLCGQIIFRDFTVSHGVVPVLLQGLVFNLFGVSWFAYCLHAALMNGLFCVLVFFFLRMFGGGLPLSFFYALLSGIVFYPPFGVPVQDQHAFFFTFVLIYLACVAVRTRRPLVKTGIWFFVPLAAAVAFLSKQIPTLFGVLVVFGILLVAERKNLRPPALSVLAGTLFMLLSVWITSRLFEIDFRLVKIYFFQIPAELGVSRFSQDFLARLMRFLHFQSLSWKMYFTPWTILLFVLGVLLFLSVVYLMGRQRSGMEVLNKAIRENPLPPVLSLSFLAICALFAFLSHNQGQNSIPLIFISIGLAHIFLRSQWNHEKDPESGSQSKQHRAVLILANLLFYGGSLWFAWNFHLNVNTTRMVHDFTYEGKADKTFGRQLPEQLSFLIWATPKSYRGTPADIAQVVEFFKQNPGNFFLVGDSSILYALTGRPSVNPALWYCPGQSIPRPASPFFTDYQDRVMQSLRKYRVRYIVLEAVRERNGQEVTWAGVNPAYLPRLDELIRAKGIERERIGPFTIMELKEPLGEGPR